MIVVFDFDKTLINSDSLFGFYKAVDGKNNWFTIKRYIVLAFAVLYKFKLISNTSLKRVGVWLYLKGKSETQIIELGKEYASKLVLNNIFHERLLKAKSDGHRCIVISAGFHEYLQFVFPSLELFASKLHFVNGHVAGLDSNMYGKEKVKKLKELGIEKVDSFYSDSFADKPLMEMSDSVFLVRDGAIIRETKQNKS